MTEPENFDDELFADLYNDDEPAKPATASVTDQQAAIRSIAESNDFRAADTSQTQTLNGADNPPENNDDDDGEEEDDDDDIDFNLGDGPSTTITTRASNDYKEEKPAQAAPPVPAAPSKGPNAKEDG